MKKIQHLSMFAALIVLSTACCQRKQDIQQNNVYNHTEMLNEHERFQNDSITFPDGSSAIFQQHYAPLNSLTTYFDRDGRVIATDALASECLNQRLVYSYNENGKLKYLLRYDDMLEQHFSNEGIDIDFRLAIDSIDFRNPDLNRHSVTEIIYGNDGNVYEITEMPSGESIKAPDGYILEVSVIPCESFWESDLYGGHFLLKADMIPTNYTGDDTIKCFEDLNFIAEKHYKNGVLLPASQH